MSVEEHTSETTPFRSGQDAVMRLSEQGAQVRGPTGQLDDFDEVMQFYRSHTIQTNQLFIFVDDLEAFRNAAEVAIANSTPQEARATEISSRKYIVRKMRALTAKSSETLGADGKRILSNVEMLLRQKVEHWQHHDIDEKHKRGLAAMGGGSRDV